MAPYVHLCGVAGCDVWGSFGYKHKHGADDQGYVWRCGQHRFVDQPPAIAPAPDSPAPAWPMAKKALQGQLL